MFIAVVGCGHGEIDKIYDVIENIEKQRQIKVDIVLCCGDFQSVRNMTDLRCMACPLKYQQMHDFYRYYSGEKKAPILTLFIGGNHEASNFLQELPYGGWVAPNIFYMGYTGVFRFGSVRIAGVSGIYKGNDYLKGRFEAPPYNDGSMRSVYHYRNLDILRLKQLKDPVDVVLSHDWPKGIYNYGNVNGLLRRKPFFIQEIESDSLGSRPLFEVLAKLHPSYWFSAHMHVKFAALFSSEDEAVEKAPPAQLDGQTSSLTETEEGNVSQASLRENKTTKFLALDKVLPRRQFLQIIEIPSDIPSENLKLEYDVEWLAILNSTNHLVSSKNSTCFMPGPGYNSRYDFTPTKEEIDDVLKRFDGKLEVPLNFSETAPSHQPGEQPQRAYHISNPQTTEFCNKLDITDPITFVVANDNRSRSSYLQNEDSDVCTHESQLGQLDITMNSTLVSESLNPDEISLDLDEEDESNNTSQADMENPSSSQSGLRRRKLELPAPRSSVGGSTDLDNDDVDGETGEKVNQDELKLLQSVFTTDSSSGNDNSASGSVNELQRLESTDHLFVIDREGETGESANPKRRRNAAFYNLPD